MSVNTRILIIDDNMIHTDVMRTLLAENGYTDVHISHTGKDGLAAIADSLPALVIIDTLLPDMNGFDICNFIVTTYSDARPRIIIMTGYIDAVDVIKARQMGADDYVVKTADFAYLLQVIRKVLSSHTS